MGLAGRCWRVLLLVLSVAGHWHSNDASRKGPGQPRKSNNEPLISTAILLLSKRALCAAFPALLSHDLQRVSNVVFMGMGEPLLNLPSVLRAHDILNKDLGIGEGRASCGLGQRAGKGWVGWWVVWKAGRTLAGRTEV